MAVEVREMPVFDLTVIPFLWSPDPNREVVEAASAMEEDPGGHELLWGTRTLLPIRDLEVTAHAPVLSSSNNMSDLLDETGVIWALEGEGGHYMGMMSRPVTGGFLGLGLIPGRVSVSIPDWSIIAHELGHNMNLEHAACGGPLGLDQSFPYLNGSIGAWGYDFRNGGRSVEPEYKDLMSYCGPEWISDYHFTNALRFRLVDERPFLVAGPTAQEAESLLLWGGADSEGAPSLNSAFVVDAPPALPDAAGEHRLTGRTASGDVLFSLDFAGGGRRGREVVLRLRSAGPGHLGRQPGKRHTLRTRRLGHARQRHRPSHDDPVRSRHGTSAGHPARPAASGRGGTRASGGAGRSRRALQPRNPRCRGLGPLRIPQIRNRRDRGIEAGEASGPEILASGPPRDRRADASEASCTTGQAILRLCPRPAGRLDVSAYGALGGQTAEDRGPRGERPLGSALRSPGSVVVAGEPGSRGIRTNGIAAAIVGVPVGAAASDQEADRAGIAVFRPSRPLCSRATGSRASLAERRPETPGGSMRD